MLLPFAALMDGEAATMATVAALTILTPTMRASKSANQRGA